MPNYQDLSNPSRRRSNRATVCLAGSVQRLAGSLTFAFDFVQRLRVRILAGIKLPKLASLWLVSRSTKSMKQPVAIDASARLKTREKSLTPKNPNGRMPIKSVTAPRTTS
jgi:hypothetical protein